MLKNLELAKMLPVSAGVSLNGALIRNNVKLKFDNFKIICFNFKY